MFGRKKRITGKFATVTWPDIPECPEHKFPDSKNGKLFGRLTVWVCAVCGRAYSMTHKFDWLRSPHHDERPNMNEVGPIPGDITVEYDTA